MFIVKEREKFQNDLTSKLKKLDSHASSMQPIRQSLETHQVLQRNLGNTYLQTISEAETQRNDDQKMLQAKLVVGSTDDAYEQEADRVAERVMKMSEPKIVAGEEEETVQRKEISGKTPEATPDLDTQIQSQRGSGQPLPPPVGTFFESRFGENFSGVRIHTDTVADQLNRNLDARAFTSKEDIFFSRGEYNPDGSRGRELLAHELTHVIQQSGRESQTDENIFRKDSDTTDSESAGLEKWDLAPAALEGAKELKKKVPTVVIFSGRRTRTEEASAWAGNIMNNKNWITNTLHPYTRNLPEIKEFQTWLDDNWDKGDSVKGNKEAIATKLEKQLDKLTDNQMKNISNHFDGLAIDVSASVDKTVLLSLPNVNSNQVFDEGNHKHVGFK